MTVNSIGDQARAFVMKTASARLKNTVDVLTKEMSSGEVADLGQRLQGNSRSLNDIEARMKMLNQYKRNAAEAASLTGAMQERLGTIHSVTSTLAVDLVVGPALPTVKLLSTRSDGVAQTFSDVVEQLNGSFAGQHLFSGLATDLPPLISANQMLDNLEAITSGLTTAADVAQAVSDWFDAAPGGGGFLDVAYSGTLGQTRQLGIAEDSAIGITTDAANPVIRDVMKGLATAALVSRGVLAGQHDEQWSLMTKGGAVIMDNDAGLIAEMARVGLNQQIVDQGQAANAAALSTLNVARNDIRSADPYETSVALTEAQSQLDALYTITARLSKLKLVEYLR